MSDDQNQNGNNNSKGSFNHAARLIGAASGISGGMIICAFSLAMYSNSDSKLWLGGAAAGVLATIGSFIQCYQISKQEAGAAEKIKTDKPKDQGPGDKPDFKP